MNTDNALMIEALIQSRKPKKVLSEDDEEFEDDHRPLWAAGAFATPKYKDIKGDTEGLPIHTIEMFGKPKNPEGIITYEEGCWMGFVGFLTDADRAAMRDNGEYAPERETTDKKTLWKDHLWAAEGPHQGGEASWNATGFQALKGGRVNPIDGLWTFYDNSGSGGWKFHGFEEGKDFVFSS